jgi:tRNA1Val (adenine37-N6)-methyltransferase
MFQFKQFSVDDALCAMKVGTDGVLIGAWVDVAGAKHILDIGTGSGLIALMVAQRSASAKVEAIDIDEGAVLQARKNIDASPWRNRISVLQSDLNSYVSTTKFDHIVSNPPFFTTTLLSPDERRAMARHCSTLSYDDIVSAAEQLLVPGGRLSLILPPCEAAQFRRVAFGRLWLCRQMDVLSRRDDAPKRTMMEFVLCDEPLMPRVDTIEIYGDGGAYSDKYRQLTAEYYLKF